VHFKGAIAAEGHMMIVMGLAERGDLRHVVQSNPDLSWRIKVEMACGVANGLRALHDMRLIHRDIKETMLLSACFDVFYPFSSRA
jgi:serine/threonine protein kinase